MASDLITPDAGEAPLTRLSFRAREGSLKKAGDAFDAALPVKPQSCATAGKRAALWLGPDEWTLLAPEDELQAVFAAIEEKLGDEPHALVNVSERSEAVIVSGEKAVWLLNTGIFIDFSLDTFPVGL